MLLSLGHVTLRSADFERTERFYCDLLGLCIGPRSAIAVPGPAARAVSIQSVVGFDAEHVALEESDFLRSVLIRTPH